MRELTDPEKREKLGMEKAQWVAASVWEGTKWAAAFLVATIPIAYALKLSDEDQTKVFAALATAAGAAFLGGAFQWAIFVITKSRIEHVNTVAAKSKTVPYVVLGSLCVLQLVALLIVVGGQLRAVLLALDVKESGGSLEYRLARRIDQYVVKHDAVDRIREFCGNHVDEPDAKKKFVTACEKFKSPLLPSADEARGLVDQLRH